MTTDSEVTVANHSQDESVVAKQFHEDPQLTIMGALALIQFAVDSRSAMYTRCNASDGNNKPLNALLSILNWIACAFVREPQEDVVATALSVERNKLTLYIAMNRGQPEDADKESATMFLHTLRDALKIGSDHEKASEASNLEKATEKLVYGALAVSRERIWRKVEMIAKMRLLPKSSDRPAYDDVISLFGYFAHRWRLYGGSDEDKLSQFYFNVYETRLKPEDVLAATLRHFMNASQPGQREEDIKKEADDQFVLCSLALALCRSNFFTTLPRTTHFPPDSTKPFGDLKDKEFAWLMKLRTRLWRLARYITDADTFVRRGFGFIRDTLQENLESFMNGGAGCSIVWVGEEMSLPPNHCQPYAWPMTPSQCLKKLLAEYVKEGNIYLDGDKQNKLDDPDFVYSLDQIWDSDGHIRPCMHCELQLIDYLGRKGITVFCNVIGVSKLMCFACNAYVAALNKNAESSGQPSWVLSGTSGKAHNAWLIPGGTVDDRVQEYIQNAMKDRIIDLAVASLGHKKQNSGGSDSSGGSIDSPTGPDHRDAAAAAAARLRRK